MREPEIVDRCVEALRQHFDVGEHELHPRGGSRWDRQIVLGKDGGRWTLGFETRRSVTAPAVSHVMNRSNAMAARKEDVIFFAEHVGPKAADHLREAGLNFVDTAGNMEIRLADPSILVRISGQRPVPPGESERSRLFQPSGLRVLLLLLAQPASINLPYREIARMAGVSLGSVSWIIRELKDRGHVHAAAGNPVLGDASSLFSRWVEAYAERLRPSIVRRKLKSPTAHVHELLPELAKRLGNREATWAATGEVAGDALTHHLVPGHLAFFTTSWAAEDERELRWVPSGTGNVTVLDFFAPIVLDDSLGNGFPLAHPILVYAELLAEDGERRRETAAAVGRKYLDHLMAK